jgi:hypothetical protein
MKKHLGRTSKSGQYNLSTIIPQYCPVRWTSHQTHIPIGPLCHGPLFWELPPTQELCPKLKICPGFVDCISSISSGAQYVTVRKYFWHPSLVMYSFATPPIKLKQGQQIAGGLLITNHLDQSLWWANQKHWAAVRSYLLHSFLQVHSAAEPFTSHGNVINYAEPKPLSWVNLHMLDFLHPFLLCRITYWPPLEMLFHPFLIWPGWTSTHAGTSTFFLEWDLLMAKWTQEMLSSFGLRDPNLV